MIGVYGVYFDVTTECAIMKKLQLEIHDRSLKVNGLKERTRTQKKNHLRLALIVKIFIDDIHTEKCASLLFITFFYVLIRTRAKSNEDSLM